MSITVSYVILDHLKKDDGTNFIRIRITHKRKSKYLKTNIAVEPSDFTRTGNLKNQGKIDLAKDEVKINRKIVDAMPTSASDEMDVDDVVRYIKAKRADGEGFRLDFASYGISLAEKMKPGTGKNYIVAMRCLVRYFGHNPDISEITVRAMRGFEEFIRQEKKMVYHVDKGIVEGDGTKSERAVNMYTGAVRAIYKKARIEFNDPDLGIMRIPVDIFEYYKVPRVPAAEHRDIPAEWIQMMLDQREGLEGRERMAIDVFLLSFGLMGINSIDLYNAKEQPKGGVLHYFRTKTTDKRADGAEMFVRIEECVRGLVNEYRGKERAFRFHTMYATDNTFNAAINKGLKSWKSRNGLENEDKFTFYSARHTWATLGASKRVGIDLALVTEGLCHVDQGRKVDMIYIRKDWERVWDANAKVLGLFRW